MKIALTRSFLEQITSNPFYLNLESIYFAFQLSYKIKLVSAGGSLGSANESEQLKVQDLLTMWS